MNIDDLKQTLSSMADEVDATDGPDRLRAIDGLVRSARRQRVSVGLGVVAVAAVGGLLVPTVLNGGDGPPAASHSQLPTIEDNGVRFYTSPAGNMLLGEKVGTPGQRSVSLRVTPTTSDLSYQSLCKQPGDDSGKLVYNVTINGKDIASQSCNNTGEPVDAGSRFGFSPRGNIRFWRNDAGVVPGRPMTLRITARPGARTTPGSAPIQLGIALYAMTGPTVEDHGVWFGQQAVYAGHTYQLESRTFRRVDGLRGQVELALPAPDDRLLITYGVADVHSSYRLTADQSGADHSGGGGSELQSLSRPGQRSALLGIRIHGKPGAVIYVLAYRQVE
jgi:hypothetical protein